MTTLSRTHADFSRANASIVDENRELWRQLDDHRAALRAAISIIADLVKLNERAMVAFDAIQDMLGQRGRAEQLPDFHERPTLAELPEVEMAVAGSEPEMPADADDGPEIEVVKPKALRRVEGSVNGNG